MFSPPFLFFLFFLIQCSPHLFYFFLFFLIQCSPHRPSWAADAFALSPSPGTSLKIVTCKVTSIKVENTDELMERTSVPPPLLPVFAQQTSGPSWWKSFSICWRLRDSTIWPCLLFSAEQAMFLKLCGHFSIEMPRCQLNRDLAGENKSQLWTSRPVSIQPPHSLAGWPS